MHYREVRNMDTINNNKLIAKNTFFLLFRSFLVIISTLYTARIVLDELGSEDFGIYSVVGGVVLMFGIVQTIMSAAVSRFFSFEIGRNDTVKLNQYFNTSVLVYGVLAGIVFIMAETFGFWLLTEKLVIPVNRVEASNTAFHIAVMSFVVSMTTVPFVALIIAREEMNVYAYMAFAEVAMKVTIANIIQLDFEDKLIVYAQMQFVSSAVVAAIIVIYCRVRIADIKYSFFWSSEILLKMTSYSTWSFFGSLSALGRNHGLTLLISMHFPPSINAARAVAYQVNDGVNQLSVGLFTAINPRITKYFSSSMQSSMVALVFSSSRIMAYLLLIPSIPILFETEYILNLWLIEVPTGSANFVKLLIVVSMIDAVGYPLMSAINATGRIKFYQIVTGTSLLLAFPISYFFLENGLTSESTMYALLISSIAAQLSRVVFMKHLHEMSISSYASEVVFKIITVLTLTIMPVYAINYFMDAGFSRFLTTVLVSPFLSILVVLFFGLGKSEKDWLNSFLKKKIKVFHA
jgi:O-antigen/teichoic acid export membrane protein